MCSDEKPRSTHSFVWSTAAVTAAPAKSTQNQYFQWIAPVPLNMLDICPKKWINCLAVVHRALLHFSEYKIWSALAKLTRSFTTNYIYLYFVQAVEMQPFTGFGKISMNIFSFMRGCLIFPNSRRLILINNLGHNFRIIRSFLAYKRNNFPQAISLRKSASVGFLILIITRFQSLGWWVKKSRPVNLSFSRVTRCIVGV